MYAGPPREFKGYLTVLSEYIDLLGGLQQSGPRAKCPSCPTLSAALYVYTYY